MLIMKNENQFLFYSLFSSFLFSLYEVTIVNIEQGNHKNIATMAKYTDICSQLIGSAHVWYVTLFACQYFVLQNVDIVIIKTCLRR